MYLLPVGIFNYVTPFIFEFFFPLLQWHARRLAKVSACVANYMCAINKIYIFYIYKRGESDKPLKENEVFPGSTFTSIVI